MASASRPPLPARDGISPQKVMLSGRVPDFPGYVAGEAGDSPFTVGERLAPGTVLAKPVPAWFHPVVPPEPVIPYTHEVLHEDADLIVVDKPHFLPSTTNGRIIRETVQTRLRVQFDEDDIVPLHRLDRLTAGVLICSRRRGTRGAYQQLFQDRAVRKTYRARVVGEPTVGRSFEFVRLRMRKEAGRRQVLVDDHGTRTETAARRVGDDVLELAPLTGHTHQLRVVLNHLGTPIVGDDTYPVDRGLPLYDFSSPLHLLATGVSFTDPLTGEHRVFRSGRDLPARVG